MSSSNRRHYHGRGREHVGRYVRLAEYMLASPAWRRLDPVARSLYVEIARRYRGPNSNNGKIPFSVREAAIALRVSPATANRAFRLLTETGFVRVSKRSGFNLKGRVSTEWLLTEFPDDTLPNVTPPTKDFMRWQPSEPGTEKEINSLAGDTHSLTTGTRMATG